MGEIIVVAAVAIVAGVALAFVSVVGPSGVRPPKVMAVRRPAEDEMTSFTGRVVLSNRTGGFGKLEVRPGHLQLRLGPVSRLVLGLIAGVRPLARHHGRRVETVPVDIGPWPIHNYRTGVLLDYGSRTAVFLPGAWGIDGVVECLQHNGFEVVHRMTPLHIQQRW